MPRYICHFSSILCENSTDSSPTLLITLAAYNWAWPPEIPLRWSWGGVNSFDVATKVCYSRVRGR